jgi:hypothetical protein
VVTSLAGIELGDHLRIRTVRPVPTAQPDERKKRCPPIRGDPVPDLIDEELLTVQDLWVRIGTNERLEPNTPDHAPYEGQPVEDGRVVTSLLQGGAERRGVPVEGLVENVANTVMRRIEPGENGGK